MARHEVGLEPILYFRIGDASIDLGPVLYFVLVFLVIAGTSNGVNLTDGLDGLAAGSCAIVLLAYTAIAFVTNEQQNLALLSACLVGACIGFLWFNAFPASIFMGDTGSLGLGGAIGALAVMTQTEVLLIIIGGIFVIEALSVAIQVFSFKTFRRRVLLMAPAPPPLRDDGLVGDQDHAPLLDHRRRLLGDRLHAVPAVDRALSATLAARLSRCLARRRGRATLSVLGRARSLTARLSRRDRAVAVHGWRRAVRRRTCRAHASEAPCDRERRRAASLEHDRRVRTSAMMRHTRVHFIGGSSSVATGRSSQRWRCDP